MSSRTSRRRSSSSPRRGRKAASKRIGSRRRSTSRSRRSTSRGRRSASRGRRSTSRGRRSQSRDSLGRFSPSPRRNRKSASRSRSRGGRRSCWSDWTLGELRMLTKELGGRMFQDRSRLCTQLTRMLGIEETLERAKEVEQAERDALREERRAEAEARREERRALAEVRRGELAARRGVSRTVRSRAPVNPSSTAGAYPGAAQAIDDFLAAYRGKSYKTQSARVAAMRRDLRDQESRDRRRQVDSNDATSYQAWKREPWNYDLSGIDSRGSDEEFLDNFTRGGFYEQMSQDGVRTWEQSPSIGTPEFGPNQRYDIPESPAPAGEILQQMRDFAARNQVETATPVTPLETAVATPLPATEGDF